MLVCDFYLIQTSGLFGTYVDILYGDIHASLGLGGNIDNPKLLSGRIDIANGTLFLSKIENPLTQIQFSSFV